jgi:hypothetical protein
MNFSKTTGYRLAFAVSIVLALLILPFMFLGCSTTAHPPTAFEKRFLDVETNATPIVVLHTNVVTVYQTNAVVQQVTQTNIVQGAPVIEHVTVTNLVSIPVLQTNITAAQGTNLEYRLTPGGGAQAVTSIGGTIGNLFGVGGLVSTALAGLFGAWSQLRSSRRYSTAAVFAQNIEAIRTFIQQLPNGKAYDAALVSFLQGHQAEAGVTEQVMEILAKEVTNKDANFAASQIAATLQALGSQVPTPPSGPVGAPLARM